MRYRSAFPFHPTTSWCFDIVSWIFLARTFAFFASFADQKLYAPPAGFMVRVQFQTPEQAARNDRWKSSRWEHWVKTGLPLMALSGDNRVMNAPDCSDPLVIARSEERRVGNEWVSTCRSRWSP